MPFITNPFICFACALTGSLARSLARSLSTKMPREDSRVAAIRNQIANELRARKRQSPAAKAHVRRLSFGGGGASGGEDFVVVTTNLVQHLSESGTDIADVDRKKMATLQVRVCGWSFAGWLVGW